MSSRLKQILIRAVALGVIGFSMPMSSSANAIIGSAIPGGSWSTPVEVWGPSFDKIEQFIVNDTGAENANWNPPGADSFGVASWNGAIINQDYVLDEGPDATYLNWTTYFTGASSNQLFDVDLLVFNDSSFLFGFRFQWDGSRFSEGVEIGNPNDAIYDRTPIPEPTTLALLGLGLAGIGCKRHRSKSAA